MTGTWSATGDMLTPHEGFPATLLRDGKVLVGAQGGRGQVYDPSTGTWAATGAMVSCCGSTATMLRDGKVLVIGYDDTGELYDPDRGTWTATGAMTTPRHSHTAILLPDGRVLVAGGHAPGDEPTDSAELYDPDTGSWTATANMHVEATSSSWPFLRPMARCWWSGPRGATRFPWRSTTRATGTWTAVGETAEANGITGPATLLADGTVLFAADERRRMPVPPRRCTTRGPGRDDRLSMLRCTRSPIHLLLDGTVLVAGGSDCNDDGVCVSTGAAELYVPAGVSPPPLPAFPSPPPPVFPSPTPRPTPLPPAAGPVPPNARSWKVTVDNKSSEPATLFVAEEDEGGKLRLVGSATPNVVPAGATVKVTFRFPANGDGWIYVNPRPGEGGSLVNADQIGIPGKILITADGQVGWLSP